MRVGWNSWSVDVSDEWTVTDHPECLTLELYNEAALQFSSARKGSGDVTDEDLQGFVKENWGSILQARCGEFKGLVVHYTEDGSEWWRWFLRNKNTVLFVTYNGGPEAVESELTAVLGVLATAKPETPSEA